MHAEPRGEWKGRRSISAGAWRLPSRVYFAPNGWSRAVKEPDNQLTLFPQMHGTDGFFISLFERNEKEE